MSVTREPAFHAWFRWIERSSTSLLARIEALEGDVFRAFDALDLKDSGVAFEETLGSIREESPLRVLRPLVGEEEYRRLTGLLSDRSRSVGPQSVS